MLNSEIRPHHGLCTAFFEGKGYSPEFVRHMTSMINYLNSQNPDIRLVLHPDSICSACPHRRNGICESERKVLLYDRQVLQFCGLKENQVLPWKEFRKLVFLRILEQGRLSAVCRNCQWQFICSEKNQKFLTTLSKYDKIEL